METGKIEHSMYSLLDRLPIFSEESDREIIRRDKEDRRERRGKDTIEEEVLPHEEWVESESTPIEIEISKSMTHSCHTDHDPDRSTHGDDLSEEEYHRKNICNRSDDHDEEESSPRDWSEDREVFLRHEEYSKRKKKTPIREYERNQLEESIYFGIFGERIRQFDDTGEGHMIREFGYSSKDRL